MRTESASSLRDLAVRLARAPAAPIDLAEAALLIAADFHPGLDVDAYLMRIDALASGAARPLRGARTDRERALTLNRYLFEGQGFRGNFEEYYDPRNSFLHEVLERRAGIPITLSVIYVGVARRLGLPAYGIGFPGHFLVGWAGDERIVIDAFVGEILSEEDCADRLRAALGPDARLERGLLEPATPRDILVRMLSNLKHIYVRARDYAAAARCCDRILWLRPDAPLELRDRGLLYEALECWAPALADLERFLALAPDDPSAETVRERLEWLRCRSTVIH